MSRHGLLRAMALAMLACAVIDPGCLVTRPPAISLVAGSEVAPAVRERLRRTIADGQPARATTGDGPHAVRIAVGSPRSLLDAHRERPIDIAVQTPEVGLHVSDVVTPRLVMAGVSTSLRVRVVGDGVATGADIAVRARDVTTGQRVGLGRGHLDARDAVWLDVPLLPTSPGRWALCIEAMRSPDGAAGPCEALELPVLPPALRVEVLEARPSWSARFARLALERWNDATIAATVRVAPPITVTTRAGGGPVEPRESGESRVSGVTDIVLVGGLEALTSADVARLARAARVDGSAVLLLADGPLDATRLRALWPYSLPSVTMAPAPLLVRVGAHAWRAREWLAPMSGATDVEALAYLDASMAVPVVMARALGAGRVVVASAVDTWRWRRAEGVTFDAAWQTLVLSLAADATLARRPAVWRVPGPLADEVHVARRTGGAHAGSAAATPAPVRLTGDAAQQAAWVEDGPGSDALRARLDVARSETPARLVLDGAVTDHRLPLVMDVGAQTLPASWLDVRRRLEADGGRVVHERDLPAALQAVSRPPVSDGTRWFVTRQWWFAAGIIGVLGLEWWWRRIARQR